MLPQPAFCCLGSSRSESTAPKHKLPEYYDNAYFDSDSDEEGTAEGQDTLFGKTEFIRAN